MLTMDTITPKIKANASAGVKRIVQQRKFYDCSVAVLSMLLDVGYEQIEAYFLSHKIKIPDDGLLVGDVVDIATWYGISLKDCGRGLRARPGYVVVPSLTYKGKMHALYYDGSKIYDPVPSGGKKYHTEMARREMKYIYEVISSEKKE